MNLLEKYKAMIEPQRQEEEKAQVAHPVKVTPQKKENAMPQYLWQNPYPKGTPEARAESLRVVEEARLAERRTEKGKQLDFSAACEEWQHTGETNTTISTEKGE